MEKEHFEILLEKIEDNFRLAFEGFDTVNSQLGVVNNRLDRLEDGHVRMEAGQETIKIDVRDIKRTVGLLHSIANNHETRLQIVETTLRDHMDNHS